MPRPWGYPLACVVAAWASLVLARPDARAEELGDQSSTEIPKAPSVPSPLDPLPDIEARDFAVTVSKRSRSGRMYLFDDTTDAKTRPGKILLLRRENDHVMAFRVVKTYKDKQQFAAKRVRRYGQIHVLDPGESYMALEKVGDVSIPPPTAQDRADLKELEGITAPGLGATPEVKEFDPDLDAAASPPPSGAVDSPTSQDAIQRDEDDEEYDDSRFGATVDEILPLDHNTQWLTGGFGFFRNNGSNLKTQEPAFFAGGGLRYGLSLGRQVFLRRAHVQDSLVAEGSGFYYKVLNYETANDAYSVISLIGTLRYNILFGDHFGIFFYGGIMQNRVASAVNASEDMVANLTSFFPAAGAGILFHVGPNWDARVDAGYESVGLGLVLRF